MTQKRLPVSSQIEVQIVSDVGAIYGPYTKTYFTSDKQTDIEHIVATSETHDSGLCLLEGKCVGHLPKIFAI